MNASRPEAEIEYSSSRGAEIAAPPTRWTVAAAGLAGAIMLVVAELTPLLRVRTAAAHPRLIRTVSAGAHHSYALLPIAALAAALTCAAWRTGSRPALAAVGLLGLAALAIALLVDLPGIHATGIVGSPAHGLSAADAQADVGLYLETLGAVLLLVSAAAGATLSGLLGLAPGERAARRGTTAS